MTYFTFTICRSSDDHSPGYDRNFYDRVSTSNNSSNNINNSNRGSNSVISSDQPEYISRRSNNYHSNDIRGRPRDRDRHFRSGPYSLIVDR